MYHGTKMKFSIKHFFSKSDQIRRKPTSVILCKCTRSWISLKTDLIITPFQFYKEFITH